MSAAELPAAAGDRPPGADGPDTPRASKAVRAPAAAAGAAGRVASLLAVFALAFGLACALLRSLVPWPGDDQLAARVEHLRSYGDRYDVLYFGSSTVRRGIDPRVVDAELAARGYALQGFNMALPQCFMPELRFLLRDVLGQEPERLRWIVIELLFMSPDGLLRSDMAFTDRAVYWHHPARLRDVFWSMVYARKPLLDFGPTALLHLRHALWWTANLGQGDRIATGLLDGDGLAREAAAAAAARGYEPLNVVEGERQHKARRQFLAHLDYYERRLQRIDPMNAEPASTDHWDIDAILELDAWIRAAGAEPVYLVTPLDTPTAPLFQLHQAGVLPHLIAFNSPARYPELYRVDHRYDDVHVNAKGAEILSRLFAERFAELLGAGQARR